MSTRRSCWWARGKTTLAQALGGLYFDLEQESERLQDQPDEWRREARLRQPGLAGRAAEGLEREPIATKLRHNVSIPPIAFRAMRRQ
ncbi:MAG: hypothetical protein ACE5JX_13380 [Acidobacteriota bacterium]